MTKIEFNKRYPEGENMIAHLFKDTFKKIMTSEEINNIIKCAKGKEKKNLIALKAAYDPSKDCPFILILQCIDSPLLFRDIVICMVGSHDTRYFGEDLPEEE